MHTTDCCLRLQLRTLSLTRIMIMIRAIDTGRSCPPRAHHNGKDPTPSVRRRHHGVALRQEEHMRIEGVHIREMHAKSSIAGPPEAKPFPPVLERTGAPTPTPEEEGKQSQLAVSARQCQLHTAWRRALDAARLARCETATGWAAVDGAWSHRLHALRRSCWRIALHRMVGQARWRKAPLRSTRDSTTRAAVLRQRLKFLIGWGERSPASGP
eukprot:scaffold1385_cov34-Tisochrysis_lutea.AAC.2